MKTTSALACGLVFGIGLAVSGMTNPAKVLAFLDVFGVWDPTLALVMGGALTVSTAGYLVARRRDRAWLGDAFALPTRRDLDPPLVGGAALFGMGWGLVGLCPGPALANLWRGSLEIGLFVGAMIAGVFAFRLVSRERSTTLATEPTSPHASLDPTAGEDR